MSQSVMCPECFVDFEVPDEALGKKVRCPHCSAKVPVETGDDDEFAAALGSAVDEVEADEPAELPKPRPKRRPAAVGAEGAPAAPSEAPKKRKRKKKRKPLVERLGLSDVDPDTIKLVVGLAAMAIFAVIGYYAVKPLFKYPPPPDIPDAQWQAFTGEGWEALFPGIPARQDLPMGELSMVMQSVQPDKNTLFAVGYMRGTIPAERANLPSDVLLDGACDGSAANLKAMGAEEVSRTPIQLGQYPGKELVMYTAEGRGHIISRNYLANGRLYIIMCGGRGYEPGQNNVEKFFGSFKIH